MDARLVYLLLIAAMCSFVIGEKCGYVPRPLAAIYDTVNTVINISCNQPTLFYDFSFHLPDNVTRVAVQLHHCHTVPVGMFINVTDSLTSVTVASKDSAELLQGTFEGLEHVTELRLLGFGFLVNLSRSVFEPLINIRTLILDQFGRYNMKLSYIGSVIRKLSGTPLERLVLNDIRSPALSKLLKDKTMQASNFKIANASVKELIISNTPMVYEGSIRSAFPDLVCFYGYTSGSQTEKSLPVMWDLTILSSTLKEFVLYGYIPYADRFDSLYTTEMFHKFIDAAEKYYLKLFSLKSQLHYAEACTFNLKMRLGANISRIAINRLGIIVGVVPKPICIEENNHLEYLDLNGSPLPSHFLGFRGLTKLKYLNLGNTRINSMAADFLQYFPALETLKLSSLDIGRFIESIDDQFFGLCPTLLKVELNNCHLKQIPATLFSKLFNLERLYVSNNSLHNLEFNLSNCTKLDILNFSSNNIKSFATKTISQLNEIALRKQEGSSLLVDLSNNRLHCLCNSTNFVKWLQRLPTDSNIKFVDYDSYTCLHPNGSFVHVSTTSVVELQEHCSVLENLANGSNCPCDNEKIQRLSRVQMSLDGFFCRNAAGDLIPMNTQPLPSCLNPFLQATFIAPVVVGGILGIAVLITVGLLIYYRKSRPIKQVRECLEMYPVRFVRAAIQYNMMHNHAEENTDFRCDIIVFVQNDDMSSVHCHFIEALEGHRRFITRDNFLPGAAIVDAMVECIRVCRWIVPVLTPNFLSDCVCVDFIGRAQFSRPHALIPVVWEQPLVVRAMSVAELLRTGDKLYWPGDMADAEDKRRFWSSLLERTPTR